MVGGCAESTGSLGELIRVCPDRGGSDGEFDTGRMVALLGAIAVRSGGGLVAEQT